MDLRLHTIYMLVLFGFFLPTTTYACGTKNEKSCSRTEIGSKTDKKECCNHKNSKNNTGCNGKCGHSNCTSSSTVNFSLISNNEIDLKNNFLGFSSEKQKFYYPKTNISSGFGFIVAPPFIR